MDTGEKCSAGEAVSTTGTKSGCMKFYAFNDKEGEETLDLILDHNTTPSVVWNSGVNSMKGPDDILIALYNDTKDWVGVITPKNYTMDQRTQPSEEYYQVIYSEPPKGETTPYKARLITAQEIAKITGADIALNWDETLETSGYYWLHNLSQDYATGNGAACKIEGCKYGWLYDRTSVDCTDYGCLNNSDVEMNGYWTVSTNAADPIGAWEVTNRGAVFGGDNKHIHSDGRVEIASGIGVRPVITVSKSNLSQ